MKYFLWICRLVASVILFQTLFFKFTGAPESVYIFDTLGAEPFGRIGAGVSELIVGILLLIPKWTKLGSLGAMGVMTGAILSHLVVLGIEVQGDGGLLFSLALVVFFASVLNLFLTKEKLEILGFSI